MLVVKIVNPHNKHVIRDGFDSLLKASQYAEKYLKPQKMDYQIVVYDKWR